MLNTKSNIRQAVISAPLVLRASILIAAVYLTYFFLQTAAIAPLWLDETWSAMIATRANWPAFWQEARLDVNPPLYYVLLSVWVEIFGDSNLMLRVPSAICVLGAAALPIVFRPRELSATAAWIWAGLILFWPFGQMVMLDARGYALLILLSTASCLASIRMLDNLCLRNAAIWVALGTLMFLTHYYAAALIAAQAIIMFWRHKSGMLRVWPAILIAVPGLAWFAYHVPRLQEYARADVVWQQRVTAQDVMGYALYIWGGLNVFVFLALILVLLFSVRNAQKIAPVDQNIPVLPSNTLMLVAATAGIGFVIAIAIGLIQASLVFRYLIPLVPPAMLLLAVPLQNNPHQATFGLIVMGLVLIPVLQTAQTRDAAFERAIYGYEKGSDFLISYKPERVLFLWDHPAAKILDRASLENVGSYFFRRAGLDVPITAFIVPETADANTVLRAAGQRDNTAVIWLYNISDRTAARAFPPSFETDPAWHCRDRSAENLYRQSIGVVACIRIGKKHD